MYVLTIWARSILSMADIPVQTRKGSAVIQRASLIIPPRSGIRNTQFDRVDRRLQRGNLASFVFRTPVNRSPSVLIAARLLRMAPPLMHRSAVLTNQPTGMSPVS